MNASFTAFSDVRWREFWKVLQPKAGCLYLAVSKLPRLDNLIRLPDPAGNDAHGVLQSDPFDVAAKQFPDESQSFGLLLLLVLKPAGPTDRQVRAGRVCNE